MILSIFMPSRELAKPMAWLVDMEVFMVTADPDGEIFVRIDGSKVRGKVSAEELPERAEPAYRPHRCRGSNDDV